VAESYELRNMIEAEQLEFADLLRGLTSEQWAAPSLCAGWSVHDVVLHIAWHTHTSDARRVAQLVGARNSEARLHEGERIRSKEDLIERLAAPAVLAGRSNVLTQLTELVLHQQDVRRPVGAPRAIPADRLAIVLDFSLTRSGGSAALASARKRAKGLRLVATDIGWRAGSGPEVRGPGEAILMALNGRAGATGDLTGDGVPILAGRIKA
jgi:uncharacterized protein (TIGR03083 family)